MISFLKRRMKQKNVVMFQVGQIINQFIKYDLVDHQIQMQINSPLNLQYMNLTQSHGMQCPVCGLEFQELYSISDCPHKFCQECCFSYIETKCESFEAIKCMTQGCQKPFNKNTIIYSRLSEDLVQKIKKHQQMVFLQKNPHMKSCASPNCQGLYNIKQKNQRGFLQCNGIGKHQNCSKCFNVAHEGACDLQADRDMAALNYKRCPKCSVWVEKTQGCQYISCKCGISFCYTCGIQFSQDPCRKNETWRKEEDIRKQLQKFRIKTPQSFIGFVFFLPKILIQSILMIFWTIGIGLFFTLIVFPLLLFAAFAFFPLIICFGISEMDDGECCFCCSSKFCFRFLLFILYPLVGFIMVLFVIILFCLYPFCKDNNHHGIYDPIDVGVAHISQCYLSVVNCLFSF